MSLLNLNLRQYDVVSVSSSDEREQPAEPVEAPDVYHIVSIKRISSGEEILLCTVDPAPDEALQEAARLDLALFTSTEIPYCKAAVESGIPDFIEWILKLKRQESKCRVCGFRPETNNNTEAVV